MVCAWLEEINAPPLGQAPTGSSRSAVMYVLISLLFLAHQNPPNLPRPGHPQADAST